MDLIHPYSKGDVVEALRGASADGRRMLAVGGRTHFDKGNPSEVDAELWTTQLDRVVAYDPAEMIAVVEAGIRVGTLDRILADGGQEWPSDAPAEATVGGVIAAAATSPRRLRVGPVRDTVLEVELVTGDGRLIKGGGRTVKNVTGYDLPRLATGSLGTLGVIVQVALKLRPRAKTRRTLAWSEGGLGLGWRLLEAVPLPVAVLAGPERVELRLEGWPEEVEEQAAAARAVAPEPEVEDDGAFPATTPWAERPFVVEASVAPSKIGELTAAAGEAWGALVGVGLVWCGLASADGELSALRTLAEELGGIAPVIRGPGGLGGATPPAPAIHRRLKHAFDPAGILAPGRFWGGI